MTEEIIIDGVNVAGCEFAVKPINDNRITCHCAKGLLQIAKMHEQPESIKSGLCENNPNCYYKQFKRAEQENSLLAYNLHIKEDEAAHYLKEVSKYRSALEEIKEDMEQDTTCESRECGCDDYAECLNCIKKTILTKINEVLPKEGQING